MLKTEMFKRLSRSQRSYRQLITVLDCLFIYKTTRSVLCVSENDNSFVRDINYFLSKLYRSLKINPIFFIYKANKNIDGNLELTMNELCEIFGRNITIINQKEEVK